MTSAEMVTTFKLGEPEEEGVKITELIKALQAHTKNMAEEYDFTPSYSIGWETPEKRIPAIYWHLIAFAVEGSCEGYYVHVGVILRAERKQQNPHYIEFGIAKTNTAESAYKLAKEAQRFLTAARWNY